MQLCSAEGMRTLDEVLANLVKENKITLEQALIKSSNQQHLKGYLGLSLPHPAL
jgi:twitching motility protein PilT